MKRPLEQGGDRVKGKKRWVVLLLAVLLILCAIVFREQITAFLQASFRPIGPGGMPFEPAA